MCVTVQSKLIITVRLTCRLCWCHSLTYSLTHTHTPNAGTTSQTSMICISNYCASWWFWCEGMFVQCIVTFRTRLCFYSAFVCVVIFSFQFLMTCPFCKCRFKKLRDITSSSDQTVSLYLPDGWVYVSLPPPTLSQPTILSSISYSTTGLDNQIRVCSTLSLPSLILVGRIPMILQAERFDVNEK